MSSEIIECGAVRYAFQLRQDPSKTVLRRRAVSHSPGVVEALGDSCERTAVLRTLIEEFGGEAVSSALRRRLVQMGSWSVTKSDDRVRRILGDLEQCGALTLEDANGADVIARIEPVGVTLAYDPPATNRSWQSAAS